MSFLLLGSGVVYAGDITVNGVSGRVDTDEQGVSKIRITAEDNIDTERKLEIVNMDNGAGVYIVALDNDTAGAVGGQNGKGLRFTGGDISVDLPGSAIDGGGSGFSLRVDSPGVQQQESSERAAEELTSDIVCDGKNFEFSGICAGVPDLARVRLELPVGTNVSRITSMLFIDNNGNYTPVPWKLNVEGNTPYVRFHITESGTVVPMKSAQIFNDVPRDIPERGAIEEAAGKLFLTGYPDGTFMPGNSISRAEFVTAMLRACGLMTMEAPVSGYLDVTESDWYSVPVDIASDNGILRGYEGFVRPLDSITGVEAASVANRIMGLFGLESIIGDEDMELLSGNTVSRAQAAETAIKVSSAVASML